jgi:hypothetical protein
MARYLGVYRVPSVRVGRTGQPRIAGSLTTTAAEETVCIDLEALEARHEPEAQTPSPYLSLIQMQRGDFNGKMLTIRHDDVRVGRHPRPVLERTDRALEDLGLRRPAFGKHPRVEHIT